MIMFGMRETPRVIGNTVVARCPRCNNVNKFDVVNSKYYLTLFWVSTVPFHSMYRLSCPICGHSFKADKDYALSKIQK
jgi:uncharacterized C2H2 Zn-finger protein